MGHHFVDVKDGKDVFTVEYSPARLMAVPLHIAAKAIEQQESVFMTEHFWPQVKEDISHLLTVDVLYEKTLNDSNELLRCSGRCRSVESGRAHWVLTLRCQECGGSGNAYTVSGIRVGCPCCDQIGTQAEAYFITDMDGRFIGWDSHDSIYAVKNFSHFHETIYVIPEDRALSLIAWFYS